MAFAAGTIWHGWSTGDAANGGGFDPTNPNMSALLACDAGTGNTASPVVSSADYTFLSRDVGALLFIQGGTNWTPGWYPIASVAAGKATLNAAVGAVVLYGTSATGLNYQRPNGLNTVAGCASVASPGTVGVWTVDYSQSTAAPITFTNLASSNGTTNPSNIVAGATGIDHNMVGNTINVTGGTNWIVQRIQIVSVSSNAATVDKAVGTAADLSAATGTGNMGGAVGTTAIVSALTMPMVAGNKVFLKGTFTLTTTTTLTAGMKGDTTSGRISVEGFTTYPGQRDGRPIITSATNSVALITANDNDFWEFIHIKFTHTAATRGNGIVGSTSISAPFVIIDCVFDGCLSAVNTAGVMAVIMNYCEVKNCTSSTGALLLHNGGSMYGCDVHDNTGDGIRSTTGNAFTLTCHDCIFDTNVIGINNVSTSGGNMTFNLRNCIFVDNTSDALKQAAVAAASVLFELINNVFWNNTGCDINNLDTQIETDAQTKINRNNASGSNGSARVGLRAGRGDVTLTADPFTNKASRDFSPNSTAGGGAALKAAGFPGLMVNGTTTDSNDIGIQATATGAAGGLLKVGGMHGGMQKS